MSFVTEKSAPLLEVLEAFSPESSKNTLKKWIKSKRVYVDNLVIEDAMALIKKGAKITLGNKKEYFKANIEILYEDQDIVVIYKPDGLLSVATDKETYYTAHDLLKTKFPKRRVYPVHRLDKDTSGVMVFAYTTFAKDLLKEQFEKHSIYREYRALVLGQLEEKRGEWKSHLLEDSFCYVYEWDETRGPAPAEAKFAITEFEVLQEAKKFSYVKFVLRTGKKNQIRVQAAHRGHPILGDKKYGPKETPISRMSLHAYALHFIHPKTQKQLCFSYPYPKEFNRMLPQK